MSTTSPDTFKIRLEANDLTRSERLTLWNALVKVEEENCLSFANKIQILEWNIENWRKGLK